MQAKPELKAMIGSFAAQENASIVHNVKLPTQRQAVAFRELRLKLDGVGLRNTDREIDRFFVLLAGRKGTQCDKSRPNSDDL
jgi:hypothetical protein